MPNNPCSTPVILLILISNSLSREINISPYAFWDHTGITIAGWTNGTKGSSSSQLNRPLDVSITINDVLYISDINNHRVVVIDLNRNNYQFIIGPITPGSSNSQFNEPHGLATTNTSLYVIDFINQRVQKLSLNGTNATTVFSLSGLHLSFYLYVDDDGDIYLSNTFDHRVLLFPINTTNSAIVAGTGVNGSQNDQLNTPYGVFVTRAEVIYVADAWNNRIMKWLPNATSGIRVAGDGTSGPSLTQLSHPTQIVVDTNEYMYISDDENHRIIRWGPNSTFGVCIVACSPGYGTSATQLYRPHSLAFDSSNSLYVCDYGNHRVQKFQIMRHIVISYNQPNITVNATWNPDGITLANESTLVLTTRGIFIDSNNRIYIPSHNKSEILKWAEGDSIPTHISIASLFPYTNLFVSVNGDIYFANGNETGRVDKWSKDSNQSFFVAKFFENCTCLFIVQNTILYCGMRDAHRIDQTFLYNPTNRSYRVAGTGSPGSAMNELERPFGIFIESNLNLYVADAGNHRIMLFRSGESFGVIIAGNGTPQSLLLNHPTDVILDADKFLYIVDNNHHRIIRFKDNQFYCIIGCTESAGSQANQLNKPYSIRFDSCGNLYVTDEYNNRLQKFLLTSNSLNSNDSSITNPTYNISYTICVLLQPCQNNGTCYLAKDNQHYNCSCPFGWSGVHCEIERIDLTSIPTSSPIQNCSITIVELVPLALSSAIPWKFRKNKNLHISSEVELVCDSSASISTKWTILHYPNESLLTSQTNLFIPAHTLSYGLYKIELTAMILNFPSIFSSSSVYVEITPSTIDINLLALDTSMIRHDYREDLHLDPGQFSFDMTAEIYYKQDWFYSYYCRIADANWTQPFKSFEDRNRLNNNSSALKQWKYNDAIRSSVTIAAESLQINTTYQFLVQVVHRINFTRRSAGYLLVKIEQIQSPVITISCVIPTMCSFMNQSYYINPTTQLTLFSLCSGDDCSSVETIQWNMYRQSINSPISSDFFYGSTTKNFTVLKEFFIENEDILHWHFEVIYSFKSGNSTDSFDIEINQPPKNGNCSIEPLNGTTLTLFTIHCFNWFDEDGIKDWTFYGSMRNSSIRMMLGRTIEPTIQLRLPSSINLISTVSVRDPFNAIREFSLPPVTILPDYSAIGHFIDSLQRSDGDVDNDTIVQLLNSEDQNTVGQLLTSLCEFFNQINDKNIESATWNGLDSTTISITSLNNERYNQRSNVTNPSISIVFENEMNKQAMIREYLMILLKNFSINTVYDIIFQSSIMSRLTTTTNQLTRKTSSLASGKCFELSNALQSMVRRMSYEETYTITTYLAECATNVFNGVNGVLQGRGKALQIDLNRAKEFSEDCTQCPWNDQFDGEHPLDHVNFYYQKQTFEEIAKKTNSMFSSLTTALDVHLNLNQTIEIQSGSVYFSVEKLSKTSLSTRLNFSAIDFPFTLDDINNTILIRRIIQPLASADRTTLATNLSRSWSLSILDENENEISIQTKINERIEFFIPRDPNLVIPMMISQNVTEKNQGNLLFNYHQVYFPSTNPNLTFAIHLEIHPLAENISYFVIHQFDRQSIDNWIVFCPKDLNNERNYVYFLDNNQTANHHSIIFGIRQLNTEEMKKFCRNDVFVRPILTEPFHFTSDYQLRLYQSACFYLDENNQWQSNGLLVGPLTNRNETQCFSTHLTTFTNAIFSN